MSDEATKLSDQELLHRFDPARLDFKSTEELPPYEGIIGQERALSAISFGINIRSHGYHMYALGPVGTGKKTIINKYLKSHAAAKPVPDDWLYVNNFSDSDTPKALRLPAGKGRKFKDDMDQFVEELKTEVPKAFESETYQKEIQENSRALNSRSKELFKKLEEKVKKAGFRLLQEPDSIGIIALVDGEALTAEKMKELDEATVQEIEKRQKMLKEEIKKTMQEVRGLQ